MEANPTVWDDERVRWADFDLVVVRSTWDYPDRRDAFLAWAGSVPRVLNAPEVLRWNTDKRYLATLGQDAVPTSFVEPGEPFAPPAVAFVVKPSVGAGSIGAARYDAGDERAGAHVDRLHDAGKTVLVQPYLEAVDHRGEIALMLGAIALVFFRDGNEVALAFAFAAVAGSFLVSYSRARAEALGLKGDVGIGSRAERVVVIVTGLVLAPWGVLPWAIYLLTATAWITVVQRVLAVRSQLRQG